MGQQHQAARLFVPLAAKAMVPGSPAWPEVTDSKWERSRQALQQVLGDLLGGRTTPPTTAERPVSKIDDAFVASLATALMATAATPNWRLKPSGSAAAIRPSLAGSPSSAD